MKQLKLLSFTALNISLLLTSCTVEKRVYLSGYHVEWKSQGQHSHEQQAAGDNNKMKETKTETFIEPGAKGISVDETMTAASTEDHPAPHKEKTNLWIVDNEQKVFEENPTEDTIRRVEKKKIADSAQGEGTRLNGFVLLGLICFLLGHFPFPYLFLLWILGLVFSFIGLRQIKNHPDKWKGKGLAKTVLITAGVEIVLSIVVLLVLLSAFTDGF